MPGTFVVFGDFIIVGQVASGSLVLCVIVSWRVLHLAVEGGFTVLIVNVVLLLFKLLWLRLDSRYVRGSVSLEKSGAEDNGNLAILFKHIFVEHQFASNVNHVSRLIN